MAEDGLKSRIGPEIGTLKQEGPYTVSPILSGPQGPQIRVGERPLASNYYLGFANDPQVVEAARAGLDRFGLGTGHHICSMDVHQEFEVRWQRSSGGSLP